MPDFLTFIIPAASSSDSNYAAFIPLVLCLSGFIYYFVIYARYRNTDKRHHHENETTATVQNLQRYDQLIEHRKGLRNASMKGRNENTIEGSLAKGGLPLNIDLSNVGGVVGSLLKK
jgi:hypothetical protein